jgi:DNA-binding NtrC family response regulator
MFFSPAAMDALARYTWPGNIRELDNVIARAVILSQTDTIEPDVLALDFGSAVGKGDHLPYLKMPYHQSMEAHSRHIIEQALQDASGNQTKAAERLKLQRTYLARLLRQQRQKLDERGDDADEGMTEPAARAEWR